MRGAIMRSCGRKGNKGSILVSSMFAPTMGIAMIRAPMASDGPLQLREQDYLPLAECAFQHWGEREGEPFTHLRPLTPDAAERIWRRTSVMAARQWAESADDA